MLITSTHLLADDRRHVDWSPCPGDDEILSRGDDIPSCEDWVPNDSIPGDETDIDAIVTNLRQLTLSSLSGYQEISEVTSNATLKSYADVISRQRSAQQRSLIEKLPRLCSGVHDRNCEGLNRMRSAWRQAIWSLEQNEIAEFVQHVEHAESILEEAYLVAANSVSDFDLADECRQNAVAICGARCVCEDLASEIVGGSHA